MDARGAIAPARHEGAAPTHMTRSSTMPASDPGGMTFPRLLMKHAAERGARPATREKDLGIWQTWTWAQVAAEVRALACGLAAQGFSRGMHLAIIGDNRPRLYWSITAAQALGGVPVPLYQDAPTPEFVYVLNNAEIAYAVVEDQEQCGLRPSDRRRGHPFVFAHGVGRRSSFLVRTMDGCGLYDQLPRIGRHGDDRFARDRSDVLLRPATRVRKSPHPGHDPDGRR